MAFFISVLLVVLILFPFTIETYKLVQDFKDNAPASYRLPDISDFWFTCVTTLVFWSLEKVYSYAFYDWYYHRMCKEKVDPEIRDMRT